MNQWINVSLFKFSLFSRVTPRADHECGRKRLNPNINTQSLGKSYNLWCLRIYSQRGIAQVWSELSDSFTKAELWLAVFITDVQDWTSYFTDQIKDVYLQSATNWAASSFHSSTIFYHNFIWKCFILWSFFILTCVGLVFKQTSKVEKRREVKESASPAVQLLQSHSYLQQLQHHGLPVSTTTDHTRCWWEQTTKSALPSTITTTFKNFTLMSINFWV